LFVFCLQFVLGLFVFCLQFVHDLLTNYWKSSNKNSLWQRHWFCNLRKFL